MSDGDSVVAVVLTALDVEYEAVCAHLRDLRKRRHSAGTIFEVGALPGSQVQVAVAITGEGNTVASVLAERALATFKPAVLLFVGIAGALHDDLRLGDVVVATHVYAYHGGRAETDGFHARPRSWEAPHHLEQLARHVARSVRRVGPLDDGAADQSPSVCFRPVAAGEVVLNSRTSPLAKQINRHYNDAAAIEMESAGAAHAAHLNRATAMVIRGISDLADGTKYETDRSDWRKVASANAAAFAAALIRELPVDAPPSTPGPRQAGQMELPVLESVTSAIPSSLVQQSDVIDERIPAERIVDRPRDLTGAALDSGPFSADPGAAAGRSSRFAIGAFARRKVAIALVASALALAITAVISLVLLGNRVAPRSRPPADPPSATYPDAAGPAAMTVLTGHQKAVNGAAFSPDGAILATASRDGTTILWNITRPEQPRRVGLLPGHTGYVYGVAFHPDGRTLATTGADRTLRLWDVTDPAEVPPPRVLRGHSGTVYGVAFHPDGQTLATSSADRTVMLWNTDAPNGYGPVAESDGGHADAVYAIDFSRKGGLLATTSRDQTAILWRINGTAAPRRAATLAGHTDFIDGAGFNPDGKLLVTASRDRTAILWDVSDSGSPRRVATLKGHTGAVVDAKFSPSGRTVATVSADRTIRLWNVGEPARPAYVATLRGHTDEIHACAFSPNGELLATTSADRTVRLWRVAD
ncbi:hypothetical protein ACQEVC_33395 [Plantactinospora sp. CA-294935]|uniref:phosphorylase family protein n=1 Tax=Plantactinospora sp. CA-294935 TaxID=3240012 RepID=UPI003D931903